MDTIIPLELRSGAVVREKRRIAAGNLVAGAVCGACNNGWMRELDSSVENLIMGASRGELDLGTATTEERWKLSRWILKTGSAFLLIDAPEKRHLGSEVFRFLKVSDFLPDGFFSFYFYIPKIEKGAACTSLDIWRLFSEVDKETMLAGDRFKFAVQYDRLVLGCAYVGSSNPCFLVVPKIHQILFVKGAKVGMGKWMEEPLSECFIPNLLNQSLINISVDLGGISS
jgi:hypothetical protein